MENRNAFCAASESRKQKPRDRTLDLPFFFRLKDITSLKSLPLPAPRESLPYWFQGNFAAVFVLNSGSENVFCLHLLIALNRGVNQSN